MRVLKRLAYEFSDLIAYATLGWCAITLLWILTQLEF
jgi:hypothetical protein